MYKLNFPSLEILNAYHERYAPIVKRKLNELLNRSIVVRFKNNLDIICKLTYGSPAYNLISKFMQDDYVRKLLIGDWDEMKGIVTEIEEIEPKFQHKLSLSKLRLRKLKQSKTVEDLNCMFKTVFVDEIYENKNDFDKDTVVSSKEIRVCPYCGAENVKSFNKANGRKYNYQLDHYLPKSKYPFLALNYNNLFTACHRCNQLGGKQEKDPIDKAFQESLPYPHHFDKNAFNFICKYTCTNGIFNDSDFLIDLDYKGNQKLHDGYTHIIPIEGYYKERQDIANKIFQQMNSINKEYIEFVERGLDIHDIVSLITPLKILGFEDVEDAARENEMHKFKIDIFNQLKKYLSTP